MPLPALAPIGASIAGGLIAGLVQFFATRAGTMLAGLGMTIIGVKAFEAFLGYVVTDIQTIVAAINAGGGGGGGHNITALAIQVAAFIGLFDAVNIVISGYMAAGSLIGMKLVMGRLGKAP